MTQTALQGYLALDKQSGVGVPGIANLATQAMFDLTSIGLSGQSEASDPDPTIGSGRSPRTEAALLGGFSVAGSMEGYLRFSLLPFLLLAAGWVESAAPAESAPGSGAWMHTFTPGPPTFLTVEASWGTAGVRRFTDVLVDNLEFSLSTEERVGFTAEMVGMGESWQVAPTAVTGPTNDGVGNWLGSAITFDGLGTYRWTEVGLSIANNLSSDEFVIGKRKLDDITPGELGIELTGTIKLGNNTPSVTDLYRAAMYGAKNATEPGLLDPYRTEAILTLGSTRKIAESGVNYKAVVTLNAAVLQAFPLEGSGADPLAAQITARAMDAGSGVGKIEVHNARATAY